jgi:selenocysteine lyase/cysteine desulfurase
MEEYFLPFKRNIIGLDQSIMTCYGPKKLLYADWTASGRCYGPIEKRFQEEILPLIGNTHTETSSTGMAMTYAYHQAQILSKARQRR